MTPCFVRTSGGMIIGPFDGYPAAREFARNCVFYVDDIYEAIAPRPDMLGPKVFNTEADGGKERYLITESVAPGGYWQGSDRALRNNPPSPFRPDRPADAPSTPHRGF